MNEGESVREIDELEDPNPTFRVKYIFLPLQNNKFVRLILLNFNYKFNL
jgi:hypothetical protein